MLKLPKNVTMVMLREERHASQKLIELNDWRSQKHKNKQDEFWKKVFVSSESNFCIFGINDRKVL